jgi:hypothetical protein
MDARVRCLHWGFPLDLASSLLLVLGKNHNSVKVSGLAGVDNPNKTINPINQRYQSSLILFRVSKKTYSSDDIAVRGICSCNFLMQE